MLLQGPDGNLWYAGDYDLQSQDYTFVRYNANTAQSTKYYIKNCSEGTCYSFRPIGLANRPDSRMWFGTDYPFVGAMDTYGNITYYTLPICYGDCDMEFGAFTGNDLWFTLQGSGGLYIGYIDVTDEKTATWHAKYDGGLTRPIVGPDGNIWFGDDTYLGRLTLSTSHTSHAITLFSTGGTSVADLLAGPDKDIWVSGAGRVSRLTTYGKVLTTTPVRYSSLWGRMAVGPDNHVWIATAQALFQNTSPKKFKKYRVPKAYKTCYATGLTLGPNGNPSVAT